MSPVRHEIQLLGEAPTGRLDVTYIRGLCRDCRTKKGWPLVVSRGRRGGETAIADVTNKALDHDGAEHNGKGDVVVKISVKGQ